MRNVLYLVTMNKILICNVDELSDTDCRQFNFTGENGENIEGFVVKSGDHISGFINQCPHLGVELNWQPDHFLDLERKYIVCAVHGALFQPEDGICVSGPCFRQSLKRLPVELIDKAVFLTFQAPYT